ncbi:hypothetical protein NIES4072_62420 [Nostoc commune NIES-4072]|uniref:Uncharacterized protein n=1 Tax=Nostoc commune NIES-4072 TaxID=2005467 RepID=A0A2R5G394_NOSCO|nr:hypothetical protein NIES4070_28540 [Nostoc commune HK-02]GBG22531.1 hypothetical protein NIES4072_62420 [Nostoc commune NIES-4072]
MGKDYILFLHGVNVRESKENERNQNYIYADKLFNLIVELVREKDRNRESHIPHPNCHKFIST